jgi:hypothetical protein
VQRAYTDIKQGELIDTYARSTFEDTRRKAAKFGAMGSTIRATKRGERRSDRRSTWTPLAQRAQDPWPRPRSRS